MANPRPPYPLHIVQIQRIRQVSPHMRRMTIDATALTGIRKDLPAQWFKIFVPLAGGDISGGRAYTVRHYDPLTQTVDVDFFLHGDTGAISAWAARVQEGDRVEISDVHPRSGVAIDPSTEEYLLIGDETALPAIGAILEALPVHARAKVYVQVRDTHEEQPLASPAMLSVHWLHREPAHDMAANTLQGLASTLQIPGPTVALWVAGESGEVAAIRSRLKRERSVDAVPMHAVGYWKRGEADHHDEEI